MFSELWKSWAVAVISIWQQLRIEGKLQFLRSFSQLNQKLWTKKVIKEEVTIDEEKRMKVIFSRCKGRAKGPKSKMPTGYAQIFS